MIDRLKQYCTLSVIELINCRSKTVRCKPITWERTTESGFRIPNEGQIVSQPYELNCTGNEHGRMHGFFNDETFNIVWLDPDHNLTECKTHKN